jgi:hypothetical protein
MIIHIWQMARIKRISDAEVLTLVAQRLLSEGNKAVSFGQIAAASGLAASTLVQRYGSLDTMKHAALAAQWEMLDQLTAASEAEALVSAKGAQGLLKDIGGMGDIPALLAASLQDRVLLERASAWRKTVESALAVRLGGGVKGRDAGALIFAAWQGRLSWDAAGGKTFRLGETLRKLADQRAI